MNKPREAYVYVAQRIDPDHPQNLGDFSVARLHNGGHLFYHYNSENERLINRGSWAMPVISKGTRIYWECIKAVERLQKEEES